MSFLMVMLSGSSIHATRRTRKMTTWRQRGLDRPGCWEHATRLGLHTSCYRRLPWEDMLFSLCIPYVFLKGEYYQPRIFWDAQRKHAFEKDVLLSRAHCWIRTSHIYGPSWLQVGGRSANPSWRSVKSTTAWCVCVHGCVNPIHVWMSQNRTAPSWTRICGSWEPLLVIHLFSKTEASLQHMVVWLL